MGNYVTRDDFEWSSQEEPHAKRRVEILSMFNIFHNQSIIYNEIAINIQIDSKIFLFRFQKNILKLKNFLV